MKQLNARYERDLTLHVNGSCAHGVVWGPDVAVSGRLELLYGMIYRRGNISQFSHLVIRLLYKKRRHMR